MSTTWPKRHQMRRARAEDLPACAAIINDVIDEMPWLPRVKSHAAIAAMFVPSLLAERQVFVAASGGQIAGYISVTAAGEVPALYLRRPARHQGLGTALLDHVKALFPGGLSLRVHEPNHDARRFYQRAGFAEDQAGREEETALGVPTLLLRWRAEA